MGKFDARVDFVRLWEGERGSLAFTKDAQVVDSISSSELMRPVVLNGDIPELTELYDEIDKHRQSVLEELLRQIIDAAKVVGNEELQAKCEAAQKLLVRDVVFCPSLYT